MQFFLNLVLILRTTVRSYYYYDSEVLILTKFKAAVVDIYHTRGASSFLRFFFSLGQEGHRLFMDGCIVVYVELQYNSRACSVPANTLCERGNTSSMQCARIVKNVRIFSF